MRLFHFSDDPQVRVFVPRAVSVSSRRPPGLEWLNGPLVWAIDAWHAPMYLFPRECPRIVIWPTDATTPADRARWFGDGSWRMVAYVEAAWRERIAATTLHRYELPAAGFQDLRDAGMFVSRTKVAPLGVETLRDLPAALRAARVRVRVVERLTPLRDAWRSTLHVSGIRLRNAQGWKRG